MDDTAAHGAESSFPRGRPTGVAAPPHDSRFDSEVTDDMETGGGGAYGAAPAQNTLTLRIQESSRQGSLQPPTRITVCRTDTVATLKAKVLQFVQAPNETNNNSSSHSHNHSASLNSLSATPSHGANDGTVTSDTSSSPVYLRLIAAGRLLAPDTSTLDHWSLLPDQVIHAVVLFVTPESPLPTLYRTEASDSDEDAVDDDSVLDDDDDRQRPSTPSPRRASHRRTTITQLGFDRLDLSRTEIAIVRLQFNRHIDAWLEHSVPRHVHEAWMHQEPVDTLRRRRWQEEAWMAVQGPTSEFRLNVPLDTVPTVPPAAPTLDPEGQPVVATRARLAGVPMIMPTLPVARDGDNTLLPLYRTLRPDAPDPVLGRRTLRPSATATATVMGTDRDFCWGFFLGFCVGFFMLVWVWMPTVPHKQKMGILLGYSFHLCLGMFQEGHKVHSNNNSNALLQEQPMDAYYGDDILIWGE